MEKKEYIKPEMEVTLMETELPMALSVADDDKTYEEGDELLGRGRRGSWGDLWSKGE